MKLLKRLRPTILDRYIVAEILPPMALGMMLFSFVLLLDPISRLTSSLVARGADIPTVLRIFLNLLPSIFATTVPMSFLLGVLVAFGRLASESEIIAMRASGLSGTPLLRPVLLLSLIAGGVTLYIMTVALPEANQSFRQQVFAIVIGKARSAVVPRVFDTKLLPNMVLYVEDVSSETGQWHNVFLHDTRIPKKPRVILAATGEPRISRERKQAELHLENGVLHAFDTEHPENYRQQSFVTLDSPLDFRQIFPETSLSRGDREMTLSQLEDRMAELRSEAGTEEEIARFEVEWHKRFAIPTACIVFGLLGVGLSLGSRKEARSSAFAISIVVIFVYYVLLRLGEQAGDTGLVPPILGMWSANVVLGALGILLLVLNHREAAFDPLDPSHYTSWIPRVPRTARAPRQHRPRQIRVVVRVPRISLPTPSLLDRYIVRLYATHFLLVLASVVSLFFLAEFMDLIDDVQHNHVKGIVVARYYVFHIFLHHLSDDSDGRPRDAARHLRPAQSQQRDDGDQGRRSQPLSRRPAGHRRRHGDRDRAVRRGRLHAARDESDGSTAFQRHQGKASPDLQPRRATLDPRQRRPQHSTTTTTSRSAIPATTAGLARASRASRSTASPCSRWTRRRGHSRTGSSSPRPPGKTRPTTSRAVGDWGSARRPPASEASTDRGPARSSRPTTSCRKRRRPTP